MIMKNNTSDTEITQDVNLPDTLAKRVKTSEIDIELSPLTSEV